MNVMREEVEETVDVMREEEGEEHQKNVVLDTDIVDLDDSGECAGAGSSMRPEIQQAVHQYQRLSSARRRARKGEEQGEGSKGEKDEAEKQLKIGECKCWMSDACAHTHAPARTDTPHKHACTQTQTRTRTHTHTHTHTHTADVVFLPCRRVGDPRSDKEGSSSYRIHVRNRLAPHSAPQYCTFQHYLQYNNG